MFEQLSIKHITNTFYHQTSELGAKGILENGFKVFEGGNQRFTEGVYLLGHPDGHYGDITLEVKFDGNYLDLSNDKFNETWWELKSKYMENNYTDLTVNMKKAFPNAQGVYFGTVVVIWEEHLNTIKSVKPYRATTDEMFQKFLNSLKTPDNASLIETIQKGFRLVMIESITTIDEFYDMELSETAMDLFSQISNREKITFNLLPKEQYHNALIEFMKYGKFMRFPDKYILEWKELLLHNIAKLYILTQIHGHESFPFDTFYDVFDYNHKTGEENNGEFSRWAKKMNKINNTEEYTKLYNWGTVYEFMDKVYDIDNLTPQFTNGHYVLSDYATEPLKKLGTELAKTDSPEEIIVLINRILDVTHQRSDIAEIFIEGGSESLERISNS